jgi:peptide/nickel transport system permease protein
VTQFIVRRLLLSIPVLLGIVFVVFVIARLLPGDPCVAELGERATEAQCNAFAARNGLDQPILAQFAIYLQHAVTGDLGNSVKFGRPVTELLGERLPLTIELSFYALVFAIVVGIPLGLASAYKRNSPVDVATMIIANLGISTPVFVLGLVFAYVFAIIFKDTFIALPPSGRLSSGLSITPIAVAWGLKDLTGPLRGVLDFFSNMYTFAALVTGQWTILFDALRHMILPAVALGTIPLAIIARITRSSLLDTLGLDYMRTARAKGLGERLVVFRHGMRNALLPVVTVIGLQLGTLLGGAVLTETIFNLAGVGRSVYEAITGRDYVVIQAFTLVIAVGYVGINLLVDISYAFLDPRIRLR